MYKKQPFRKRQKKNYYNRNKLLFMPFAIKQNRKLKFKGVWEHYDT